MTDNEIIKAVECCNKPIRENSCTECAFYRSGKCSSNMLNAALNLINRQKAEIEKIKKNLQYYLNTNEENGVVYIPKFVVDDLVKEITEENENDRA